jgi:hypothetical protein
MSVTCCPVVFLDIDGVLNGHEFLVESRSCKIDRACVERLNRILKATDARIVLSSAWRYMVHGHAMTLQGFQYMLQTHGMVGSVNGSERVIVDVTCRDQDLADRPDQIRAWLEACAPHDEWRYVILDDGDFVWGDLNIIQTDGSKGLTDEDAERAIASLAEAEIEEELTC